MEQKGEQPNLLFVIIDALRAMNLGCYGYSKPTSPNIDNLAKEGVLFEDAFSCAIFTDPSLTTIFSGKYPLSHGILRHGTRVSKEDIQKFNENGPLLLPEILKSDGYATLAVDWLGRWHKRGYDYYSGILSPKKLKLYSLIKKLFKLNKLSPYLTHTKLIDDARIVTDKAISLLKRIYDKKFFFFVHYWDTHIPYNPPKHHLEPFLNGDYGDDQSIEEVLSQFDPYHLQYMKNRIMRGTKGVNEVLARYDGAIAFVDHQISRLIETLEKYGILEETFIILTSDHGESLREHGIYFGHHGLYDVTIHVPLIFRYSRFPKGKRIRSFVQHIDLVPTILDILNMKTGFTFDGESVVPLMYDKIRELRKVIYIEETDVEQKKAIRTNSFKYIYALSNEDALCKACGRIHGDVEELYDLKDDPEENRNIVKDKPYEARRLREKLFRWAMLSTKA